MLRLAVIGAGGHSSVSHGPGLQALKAERPSDVELAAVCDLDEQRAQTYAEKFGFRKTYTDLNAMYEAEQPDGVICVVPIPLIESMTAELLPRGVPVLIEKSPGKSSEQTRRMLALAEETGTTHMISFNRRFNPAVVKAREWLAENAADRPPHLFLSRMLRNNRREQDFAVGTAIHPIDTVLSFLGKPDHVSAARKPGSVEGCYSFTARATFPSGASAVFVVSTEVGAVEETYEIHGLNYCLQVDAMECVFRAFDKGEGTEHWQSPADAPLGFDSGALGEADAFCRLIRGEKGVQPDLREGLVTMLVAEAVQQAADVDIDVG